MSATSKPSAAARARYSSSRLPTTTVRPLAARLTRHRRTEVAVADDGDGRAGQRRRVGVGAGVHVEVHADASSHGPILGRFAYRLASVVGQDCCMADRRDGRPRRTRQGAGALLRSDGFRRLPLGQLVSGIGDWMVTLALMVLVLDVSGSSAAVGAVLVLRLLPTLVAGPLVARVVQRWDRRSTMLAMDAGRVVIVLAIPLVDALWWIYVWAFLLELAGLIFLPARDAAVPDLARPESLPLANGVMLASSYGTIPIGALVLRARLVDRRRRRPGCRVRRRRGHVRRVVLVHRRVHLVDAPAHRPTSDGGRFRRRPAAADRAGRRSGGAGHGARAGNAVLDGRGVRPGRARRLDLPVRRPRRPVRRRRRRWASVCSPPPGAPTSTSSDSASPRRVSSSRR